MFSAALFTIPKTGSLPRCPSMDEWIKNHAVMLSHLSCVWLFVILWTRACQAALSVGFSRQEYWSGLPFPPPGDLPDPGIQLISKPTIVPLFHNLLFENVKVWKVGVLVAQSCLTLCYPVDCSPAGSSVCGILQARILEWIAMPSSRGSSQLRDQTRVSGVSGRFFTV